ncbi:MAG: J domain-containing protein, partial [Anaerolinea sp.]|nr:J domain-containing protein [Anaerolinea sp.]
AETTDWDPWDEFQRQYGDASEYMGAADGPGFDFDSFDRTGQTRATTRQRRHAQPHHYAALGLTMSSTITLDEVKQAYRRKARENHPDLHPSEKDKYTERMTLINAAFEAISRDLE